MKLKHISIFFIPFLLIINGCEDENSSSDNDHDHDHDEIEVITHDIDAENASGFYYDLVSETEVDSSSTWHISFQMIPISAGPSTYMMPSLVLGGVYAAEYTNVAFDDMDTSPGTFMSDYFQDPTVVQYGGANEVLSYDMQTHTVSINNSDRVFVIYEPMGHTTHKVQFIEYVGGVISFTFAHFNEQ